MTKSEHSIVGELISFQQVRLIGVRDRKVARELLANHSDLHVHEIHAYGRHETRLVRDSCIYLSGSGYPYDNRRAESPLVCD